jgi:nitric oxide reductase NorD protein
MAEAEDVITDAARHATSYVQALWRRHRPSPGATPTWGLADLAARIDLLVLAVFGESWPIRTSQPPAPPGLLARLANRHRGPIARTAVPATDGTQLWLPSDLGLTNEREAAETYKMLALRQAMRARRGSASAWARAKTPLEQDLVLVLEADAADSDLIRWLPGLALALDAMRTQVLGARPLPTLFPPAGRPLEQAVRERLMNAPDPAATLTADGTLQFARTWAATLAGGVAYRGPPLFKDAWTGELRAPPLRAPEPHDAVDGTLELDAGAPRSAHLTRVPRVRPAPEAEDDRGPGAWMVQASQPHEMAADPMGLQRPTDRDVDTAAEEFAEDLSELAEAQLVSTPGQAKEVLLSDNPPETYAHQARQAPRPVSAAAGHVFDYPEWDYRASAYRHPGARAHVLPAVNGDPAWVQATLTRHRSLLAGVRRGFEMLKADRVGLRRQLEGDDIDFEALVEARADYAAGLPMAQTLYRATRPARRSLAITLLVDISGSTDSWVTAGKRVIDVEREALLLVCLALDGLREPYSVLGFSGQGAHGVVVREIKLFDEAFADTVALRIAGLEPEHYTRAGTALRHAAAALMRLPVRHRLLLLLSDGKPNDDDVYEGRYGVEDLRQAVVEARLQGINPFCLTIDRSAASYLSRVFGAHHYVLLREPERLPGALLAWLRRLVLH